MPNPPQFRPGRGDPAARIGAMEFYLAEQAEYARGRDEAVAMGIKELERRMSNLEAWKTEVLIFIGGMKLKWGAVLFLASGLASVLTLALGKVLHL